MIRWLADNWLLALVGWFLAGCILAPLLGLLIRDPHQHPHRNSAEGTRGVGVDQFHNRSTSL